MFKIENLSKSYGEKTVLSQFSAVLPEGEITCLMGASGSGKTTLLRILTGLEKKDSGSLEGFSGKKISVVFQEDRLCENISPIANIRLCAPNDCKKEEILMGMKAVGLFDYEKQPVRELSGGMKRRIALLRALFSTYDILYLDEPFQGLDEETKKLTTQYFKEKTSGKTVFFITHSLEESKSLPVTNILRLP